MAAWSNSPFLQALGWAMLNSFWQMGLLYVFYLLLESLAARSPQKKYLLATGFLLAGFFWFLYTFISFYQNGVAGTIIARHDSTPTSKTWNTILSSLSIVYMFLLLMPVYRFYKNWQHIGHLKKTASIKVALEYRLFIKKIARHLGIKRIVRIYISPFVQSPVTIGCLKPIILMPLAAMNNLNTQQVEAVLLHELAHIKRHDYLFNIIITFLQTLLYFNPFVKKFTDLIEFEREKCCDNLVLQFQYDKISYAAALLLLEKNILRNETLALAAAGKNHLLKRVEKIVGLETTGAFSVSKFTSILASILFLFLFNSFLYTAKEIAAPEIPYFATGRNPLYQIIDKEDVKRTFSKAQSTQTKPSTTKYARKKPQLYKKNAFNNIGGDFQPLNSDLMPASYLATGKELAPEQKTQIKETLKATKSILAKTKWKEVEISIGDGMTTREKNAAKNEYAKELNKIDWNLIETQLQSRYQAVNWLELSQKLNTAMVDFKLDSLQTVYHKIATRIQHTYSKEQIVYKSSSLPLPDISMHEINLIKKELNVKIDSIKTIRQREIIDF